MLNPDAGFFEEFRRAALMSFPQRVDKRQQRIYDDKRREKIRSVKNQRARGKMRNIRIGHLWEAGRLTS